MWGGVTNHTDTLHVTFSASFRGCMVAIRDASYFCQSTPSPAHFSFLEKSEDAPLI